MRPQSITLGERHGAAPVEVRRRGKVDVFDAGLGKAQPG